MEEEMHINPKKLREVLRGTGLSFLAQADVLKKLDAPKSVVSPGQRVDVTGGRSGIVAAASLRKSNRDSGTLRVWLADNTGRYYTSYPFGYYEVNNGIDLVEPVNL